MARFPFGFDKPQDSPGFLLWQTTVVWQRLVKKVLEPYDVSHAQFVVMALLLWLGEHSYDTTQAMIAEWTKLDKMTVSKALKALTLRGFVHRIEHKVDTRAKSVTLSKQGVKIIKELVPKVEQVDAMFFGKLLDNQQQTLIDLLLSLSGDNDK